MADKAIGELLEAQTITPSDLFVLEQNNTAKKLSGQTFINDMTSYLDGHGGIQSIAKVSTSGLKDTYRITFADLSTYDFIVTNGAKGDKGDNSYVWIKYSSKNPTQNSDMYDTPDDWMGIYSGNAASAPTSYSAYKWFNIKGVKGDTGNPATLTDYSVSYQSSASGTVIPSGNWYTEVPAIAPGSFLWTRVTISFNSGSPIVSYSVSRYGIDGSGSVASVNNVSPDGNGNVTLSAADVGALPSSYSPPVLSVNDQVGKVELTAEDVGARPNTWVPTASDVKAIPNTTGAVGTANLADGAVTADKIADGSVSTDYTATIGTGWVGDAAPYSIEVPVNGILASDWPLIDLYPSSDYAATLQQIEAWGYVYKADTAANQIAFYATEKPTVSIPIKIKVVRK